jgi:hypothetical protein
MSSAALKHQDVSGNALREDLLDIITDLSPAETPLFTGLQKGKAYQTVHEWNNITTGRSSSVSAAVEGGDVSFSNLTTPTRSRNYVQKLPNLTKSQLRHRIVPSLVCPTHSLSIVPEQ